MKQTMLVAVAAAAIGAATAVVLTDKPPPASRSPGPARALNVAGIESAFVRALERVGFGRQARAAPGPAAESSAEDDTRPSGTPDSPSTRGTDVEPLPAANLPVLTSLSSFEKDERLRRSWMFRSERDVIEWLGTPTRVEVAAGGNEWWYYDLSDGKYAKLVVNRGRLLNIWRSP